MYVIRYTFRNILQPEILVLSFVSFQVSNLHKAWFKVTKIFIVTGWTNIIVNIFKLVYGYGIPLY